MQETRPLQSIVDEIDRSCAKDDANLQDVIDAIGNRSFGPIITLCGLALVTPLGAIPGAPLIISTIMIVISIRILLGYETVWTPDWLHKIPVRKKVARQANRKVRPWFAAIDGFLRPRLKWAATKIFWKISAVMCLILGISLIPLGPVPFGVALPGILTMILGLGLSARDGLVILISFILFTVFAYLIYGLLNI